LVNQTFLNKKKVKSCLIIRLKDLLSKKNKKIIGLKDKVKGYVW
jgi:hypothetical protein